MRTAAFHWSGGKDSALGLSTLLAQGDVVVDRLVTTIHPERRESSVHGLPVDLLDAQARSIGIRLQTIPLAGAGLDGYVDVMRAAAVQMRHEGIDAFAFGDLACSDVRRLKEEQFGPLGLEVLEPLWGMTSRECIDRFLLSGIRAVTVVVDANVLGKDDVGVRLDRQFVDGLPAGTDPCGEFGEYHSFAYDGPLFHRPVGFSLGAPRRLEREIKTTEGMRRYAYWLATPQRNHLRGLARWEADLHRRIGPWVGEGGLNHLTTLPRGPANTGFPRPGPQTGSHRGVPRGTERYPDAIGWDMSHPMINAASIPPRADYQSDTVKAWTC